MRCTLTPTTRAYGYIIDGLWGPVRFRYSPTGTIVMCSIGDDKELLEREIAIIQDLLDEQSDSKCRV